MELGECKLVGGRASFASDGFSLKSEARGEIPRPPGGSFKEAAWWGVGVNRKNETHKITLANEGTSIIIVSTCKGKMIAGK